MMLTKHIALYLLLLTSLQTLAVEAKGFVRPEACSFFESDRLHLVSIGNHKLNKPIVLKFPGEGAWDYLLNTWSEVSGADCSADDRCESVAHSKIRIQYVARGIFIPFRGRRINGISGDFAVEFSDGRKLEGSFRAKTRKPEHQMICE
jgi:hypothetical protein